MKLEIRFYRFELRGRRKEKHEHLKTTYGLSTISAQLSEGKMVGHLSGLYNKLRKLNTTVSLSCIFYAVSDGWWFKAVMKETLSSISTCKYLFL